MVTTSFPEAFKKQYRKIDLDKLMSSQEPFSYPRPRLSQHKVVPGPLYYRDGVLLYPLLGLAQAMGVLLLVFVLVTFTLTEYFELYALHSPEEARG